jgi:hypothetical protein
MPIIGTNVFLGGTLVGQTYLGNDRVEYTPFESGVTFIRPDTYASSVTVAIPGTQFGSTFGQASYRSDISGYINGGSSLSDQTVTGTPVSNSTVKFGSDGYTTSMERPASSTLGNIAGTTTNINFGSGDFTVEVWFKPKTSNSGNSTILWSYNNGCGFFGWSSAGYYRWVAQNSTAGEDVQDYVTSAPSVGDWHHIFMSRSGTTWYGGVDGVIRTTAADFTLSGAVGTTATFQMMGLGSDSSAFNTLFQDFRVTKGVARYTGTNGSTYTVPESIVIVN